MYCIISEIFLNVQVASPIMSDYKIEGAAIYMEVGYLLSDLPTSSANGLLYFR